MENQIDTGLTLLTDWGLRVLAAVLILIAGWVLGNWARHWISNFKKLDDTLTSFLGGLAKYTVLAIAFVTVLAQFGVQTASLITVLGAAGLAIGLALQGTLSNVAAGVMLLILRPFNVGDYIQANNIGGTVKSLGLFGTEMATPDNVFIFMPNSQVWNSDIWNFSRNTQRRLDLPVSISFDEDIDKAIKVLTKLTDGEDRLVRTEGKEPKILVSAMGAYSIDLIVRVWCNTSDYWPLNWEMTKAIKETLDKNKITIPFPTQIELQKPIAETSKSSSSASKSKKQSGKAA